MKTVSFDGFIHYDYSLSKYCDVNIHLDIWFIINESEGFQCEGAD